jgi:hypothetical protein
MRGVRAAAAVPLAALVVACLLQPSCGGTRRSATPAAEEAEALLADGLARKRMLTGKIGPSNVHIVEGAIAKFEEALAVYEAALPGGAEPPSPTRAARFARSCAPTHTALCCCAPRACPQAATRPRRLGCRRVRSSTSRAAAAGA